MQSGDLQAFNTFYHRHFNALFLTAYKRLKHTEAVKDIIQEVFADLWYRRNKISNDNPVAYLHTAVRFQVFKYAAHSANQSFLEPADEMRAFTSLPEDHLYYGELVKLLELWIHTLPEKRREIFLLHYKEQLSSAMIADKLNISRKTVQNQLGLAFNELKSKWPDMAILLAVSGHMIIR